MTDIKPDRPHQGGRISSVPGAAVPSFSLWPADRTDSKENTAHDHDRTHICLPTRSGRGLC